MVNLNLKVKFKISLFVAKKEKIVLQAAIFLKSKQYYIYLVNKFIRIHWILAINDSYYVVRNFNKEDFFAASEIEFTKYSRGMYRVERHYRNLNRKYNICDDIEIKHKVRVQKEEEIDKDFVEFDDEHIYRQS